MPILLTTKANIRSLANNGFATTPLLVFCHSLIFGLDISRNALATGSTGASALRLIFTNRILGCDRALESFLRLVPLCERIHDGLLPL